MLGATTPGPAGSSSLAGLRASFSIVGLKTTIILTMALYYSRFSSSLAISFTGPGDLLGVGTQTLISEVSELLITMPFSGYS